MLCFTVPLVGMRRFELPTSSTPCWRDTGLRYIPKYYKTLVSEFSQPVSPILSGRNTVLSYIPKIFGGTNI